MDGPGVPMLVRGALRCYPARWRRRHGEEAAEVAVLLIRDGGAASMIATSYLAGAVREWLTPLPGRRVSPVACALLAVACSLAASAGLLASAGPARAAARQGHGAAHCVVRPGTAAGRADFGQRMLHRGGSGWLVLLKPIKASAPAGPSGAGAGGGC
jgi:hypothetical protein